MGKQSTRENKTIYQLCREAAGLTRAEASDKMEAVSDSKIEKIDDHIELSYPIETIDGTGCILTPGLIDRHVHITGGGGEAGFISRARPIDVQEILDAGITTVIGLLGTDGYTRSTKELFAGVEI